MRPTVDDALRLYQKEYFEFKEEGDEPAAFERLAYIYNVVENNALARKTNYKLKEVVESALREFASFDRVKVRLVENTERAMKILSIGSEFDEDELLLVLTLLMEVELGLALLRHLNSDFIDPNIELVNSDLESLSRGNRRSLESAKKMIRTNCTLPVTSRYL